MNRREFIKLSTLFLAGCSVPTLTVTATPPARPTRTPTSTKTPVPTITPPPVPTTQTFDIQSAIDAAAVGSQKLVRVPPGGYDVTTTIQCAQYVALDLTGVTLNLRADVDVIRCKPGAHITGGWIDCSLIPSFTHAGLFFDGSDHFGNAFPTWIKNMQFMGHWKTAARMGTAIKLEAINTGNVFGVHLDNVGITYFDKGIHLNASNSTTGGWVNGNQGSNISMNHCLDFIRLDNADGNTFGNVQIQADASRRALFCSGKYNIFSSLLVWDWVVGTPAIELTDVYGYNVITTQLLHQWFPTHIKNDGGYNKIINSIA